MNTLPASTLIAAVLNEIEETARKAGNEPTANAANKAAYELLKGCEVLVDPHTGDLLVPSRTDAGAIYRVRSEAGCSCKAAQNGRTCWHAELASAIATARELAVAELDDAADALASADYVPVGPALSDPAADELPDYLRAIAELYPDGRI